MVDEVDKQIENEIMFLYAFTKKVYEPTKKINIEDELFCEYCNKLMEKSCLQLLFLI
jgi:hypothetical protein